MRIEAVVERDHGIAVTVDARTVELSWRWLRDHARDPDSFHVSAQQRLVTPAAVAAAGAGDVAVAADRSALTVTWPSGPAPTFSADFLHGLGPATAAIGVDGDVVPWRGDELGGRLTTVTADELATADGFRRALAGLRRDGLLRIGQVPTDTAATRRVLERFGYVRSTIFGDLWEFGSDGALADTASTRLEITPHTDGTYSNDAPGLLALHCLVYAACGGENVFVDGHAIAARIEAERPDHLDTLRTIDVPGQYVGDGAHLVAARPVLRYVADRLVQISYNHHDRAPFLLPEPTMSDLYDALHHVDRLAGDREFQFELAMRPGDMVVIDNWRVLHGRRTFTGERHLAGGYVNREDVDSTMRTTLGPAVDRPPAAAG